MSPVGYVIRTKRPECRPDATLSFHAACFCARTFYNGGVSETTYIYGLICPETKRIRYVGKSDNPNERIRQHIQDAKASRNKNPRLQRWIRNLLTSGLEPILLILDRVPSLAWERYEMMWISEIGKSRIGLCNLDAGGQGATSGKPKSPSHRKAIGRAQIGKIISAESREKMRHAALGRKVSAETRKKQSLARMGAKNHNFGRPRDPDTREKVRIGVLRAYKEGRLNTAGRNNPMWRRPVSPITRGRIRAAAIARNMRRELYGDPIQ